MKEKISYSQLFAFVYFIFKGGPILYGVATEARQTSWLVLALVTPIYMVLFLIYVYILISFPNKRLTQIIEELTGKFIGKFIILLYGAYFIYWASRNYVATASFVQVFVLDDTPINIVIISLLIVSCYSLFLGIEVIARTTRYFLYIVNIFMAIVIFMVILNSFLYVSIDFTRLTPILEKGWDPVLNNIDKVLFAPLGEIVLILMLFSSIKDTKKGIKVIYLSIVVSVLVVIINVILAITILGPDIYQISIYSLFMYTKSIQFQYFRNIDSLVVIFVVLLLFIKVIITIYGGLVALQDVFKLRSYKIFIIPVAIIILIMSTKMTSNMILFRYVYNEVLPYYVHLPIQFGIPLILMILTFIRKRRIKTP